MLGEFCVIKSQNLSNLCIEHVQKHVQKHQIETVVSTLKWFLVYCLMEICCNMWSKKGFKQIVIDPVVEVNWLTGSF